MHSAAVTELALAWAMVAIGALLVYEGALGLIDTAAFVGLSATARGFTGLLTVGRTALGLTLVAAAGGSAWPVAIRTYGVYLTVLGLATPLLTDPLASTLATWLHTGHPGRVQAWAAHLAAAGLLVLACSPWHRLLLAHRKLQ